MDLYLMRKANGEPFWLELDGNRYLALWPSHQAALRYKAKNPELVVFLPAKLDRNWAIRLRQMAIGETMRFWLLDEEDPSASFESGRIIEWPDILSAAGYAEVEIKHMVEPAERAEAGARA
jgi:hypothetical protein